MEEFVREFSVPQADGSRIQVKTYITKKDGEWHITAYDPEGKDFPHEASSFPSREAAIEFLNKVIQT